MAKLGIVVCGAPLASRTKDVATAAEAAGWEVGVTVTAAAEHWTSTVDLSPAAREADAFLVCPLTFNTANKWALGIADTSWLGVLNEALASGKRIVAVPMVNQTLWRHPAWDGTLARLAASGAVLVDPATGNTAPAPVPHGSGDSLARAFDPAWVLNLLA